MTPKVIAIIPAAGSGKRLKGLRGKKPFVLLGGKPLVTYALKVFDSSVDIDSIIIAVERPFIKRMKGIIDKYGFKKIIKVVKGGRTRNESVRNCFNAISVPCSTVVIHDAARPFPEKSIIRDSVMAAKKFGAGIAAIPMTDTVKLADKNFFIKNTLNRAYLWRAQTPQAFRYELLKKALKGAKNILNLTDDASVLERLGKRVKIVEGSAKNIKITTKADLKIAEALL